MSMIETVDLSRWRSGGADADAVATEVDEGLQRAGFILVTSHGVDPALASAVRQAQPCRFDVPSIMILLSGTAIRATSWAAADPAKSASIAMAVIGVLVIVPPS